MKSYGSGMHVEIVIEWTTVLWHFDNQFSIGQPFRHDFHCSLTSSLIFISRTAADSEFNAVTSKKSLSSLNNYNRRKQKDKPIRTWRKYVQPLSTSCADKRKQATLNQFWLSGASFLSCQTEWSKTKGTRLKTALIQIISIGECVVAAVFPLHPGPWQATYQQQVLH